MGGPAALLGPARARSAHQDHGSQGAHGRRVQEEGLDGWFKTRRSLLRQLGAACWLRLCRALRYCLCCLIVFAYARESVCYLVLCASRSSPPLLSHMVPAPL